MGLLAVLFLARASLAPAGDLSVLRTAGAWARKTTVSLHGKCDGRYEAKQRFHKAIMC